MAFKIKEGLVVKTTTVFNDEGVLQVNAPAWQNARTITVTGDASGSVQLDGSTDATLELTITGLEGGEFTGNLTGDVKNTDGTTVLDSGSDSVSAEFTGNVTGDVKADNGNVVLDSGTDGTDATFTGDVTGDLTGNADTATTWETARDLTVTLTGDVAGTVTQSVDGSGNVTFSVATTVQADSVELGTDTTGDYVADVSVTAGTGLSVSGTGEGASVVLAGVDATDTVKGVASFAAADFNVTSGAVELEDTVVKGLTVDGSAAVTPSAHSVQITGGEGMDVTADGAVITVAGEDATDTNKGIASFSSDNFLVSLGAVTIKDGGVANAELANSSLTIGSTTVELGTTETALAGLTQLDVDNVRVDGDTISTTNTDGDLSLAPNGSGTVVVPAGYESRTGFGSSSLVNKAYVDAVAEGLSIKPAVRAATTANLTATYDNGTAGVGATLTATSNGAFPTIDGVSGWSQFDGILVKDQTNAAENGRYYVSQVGDAGTPWILTRCGKCDEPTEIPSMFVFVQEGTLYNSTGWVATVDTLPMTVGTDDVVFEQFSGAGTYLGGDGLDLTGGTFSVNVDDVTIEINADTLRVKDAGITADKLATNSVTTAKIVDGDVTNAKLANSTITIDADSGTADPVSLGETLTFTGTDPVQTAVTGNTITISVDDATTTTKGIASFDADDFDVASGAVTLEDTVLKAITTDTGALTIASHAVSILGGEGMNVTHAGTTITVAGELASTSNAGVAQFSSDNFAVDGSGVVTIKADGVILGTETTGDYVASLVAGTGIDITNNSGETATPTITHYTPSTVGSDVTAVSNTFVDAITFDAFGHVTAVATGTIDFNVADNYAFKTISVSGQTNVVADSNVDTLTLAEGSNITITTDATTDTITISSSASGDSAFDTVTDTVTTDAAEVIDSFAKATYRSAKYYVQADDGTNYQASEVMVIHNGTSVEIIEYAVVELGDPIGDISAAINGDNVEISFDRNDTLDVDVDIVIKRLLIEV